MLKGARRYLGAGQTGQASGQADCNLHPKFSGLPVFFRCKPGPYLGIQHDFWSPVPASGHILCQEPCVVVVRICNTGQAKVTDLGENKTGHLRESKSLTAEHHKCCCSHAPRSKGLTRALSCLALTTAERQTPRVRKGQAGELLHGTHFQRYAASTDLLTHSNPA